MGEEDTVGIVEEELPGADPGEGVSSLAA